MPQITLPLRPTRFLTSEGQVTPHLMNNFEEVCVHYLPVAEFLADKIKKRPLKEYAIRQVHVVGSVLEGVTNSDIDLLILADKIDWTDYRFFKLALSEVFFNNRSKYSAIDVFVQPEDDRPANNRWDITKQLKDPINSLNSKLGYFRG